MIWKKVWDIAKLIGPYVIEMIVAIIKSPKQASDNLKARGIIHDK